MALQRLVVNLPPDLSRRVIGDEVANTHFGQLCTLQTLCFLDSTEFCKMQKLRASQLWDLHMAGQSQEPPAVDPDNVPDTLCIGRFSVAPGPGPLVTLTFTNGRAKAGPLFDQNVVVMESVVRARIVTTIENLTALRDLLNAIIKEPGAAAASAGGAQKLN